MKKLIHLFIIILSVFVLTACQSKWSPEVNLTPEEIISIQEKMEELEALKNAEIEQNGKAEIVTYISIAREYQKLGELRKVEKIYKGMIADNRVSSAIHNNLANLYEEVGEYKKALEQYTILTDTLLEPQYLKNITWVYIKMGERKLAEKYFNAWQQAYRTTDEEIQNAIKELRAAEKAAK